jgi:sugar-specific transcriptional regulator TrmB
LQPSQLQQVSKGLEGKKKKVQGLDPAENCLKNKKEKFENEKENLHELCDRFKLRKNESQKNKCSFESKK